MSDKLVLCFRFPDLAADPEVHFARARELLEQATAHGAAALATGIELYAFELDPDALEDGVDFVVDVARRGAAGGILAVGISEGPLARSDALGDKHTLSWGPALAHAALLACVAEPGEIVVDAATRAARDGLLSVRGARTAAHAGVRAHGFVLDKEHPWKNAPVADAPVQSASASPPPDSDGDIDLLSSVPPAHPASAAVEALRSGDLKAVERMAEKARQHHGRAGLADRLDAMAHLARGETSDAIRRLESAAEAARRDGSRDRCRASLALALAFSAAGRHEDALFRALDALARAREMDDFRGELATLRFLSRLATLAGQVEIAGQWAALPYGAAP
ncbi:MAG TPA: hypothetical protein VH062_37500 [Polyangiaceae bacterium]|jgi:hypothetical protein|nr:hypothetical protein [Polyangiaceae bacterium]